MDLTQRIYIITPLIRPHTQTNAKTDYQEASRLEFWHHVANSSKEAARLSLLDTSTDQFTSQAVFPSDVLALVREGIVGVWRAVIYPLHVRV